MSNKVAAFTATPDPTFGQQTPSGTPSNGPPAEPIPRITDPADLRLIIEDDKASGSYVYKTINRRTGEIVQQLPREEILRLREAYRYLPGDVIRAKA